MISYSICLSLWLISLSIISSSSIHIVTEDRILFLFWLNNIPLHIYHTFFIHPSADGHLGCFYILAIVDSAALNTEVHVSFQTGVCIFLDVNPRKELLGCVGLFLIGLFLICRESSISFPILAALIHLPTNRVQVFPFLSMFIYYL